jgi:hypothetical protein
MVQYTKGVGRPVRKIHSFLNCVPYSVQTNSLDYDAERVIKRTVGWIYNHYTYRLLQGEETGIPIGKLVPSARSLGGVGAAIGGMIPKGIPVENVPKVIPMAPPRAIPVTEQDQPITPW